LKPYKAQADWGPRFRARRRFIRQTQQATPPMAVMFPESIGSLSERGYPVEKYDRTNDRDERQARKDRNINTSGVLTKKRSLYI